MNPKKEYKEYKICVNLEKKERFGFVCKLDLEKCPDYYYAARCMLDPHASAYIDTDYCENFEEVKEI